jgi:hypothetical protein
MTVRRTLDGGRRGEWDGWIGVTSGRASDAGIDEGTTRWRRRVEGIGRGATFWTRQGREIRAGEKMWLEGTKLRRPGASVDG